MGKHPPLPISGRAAVDTDEDGNRMDGMIARGVGIAGLILVMGTAVVSAQELFPLEDVRPGLEAQVVTVLKGFEPDTLELEILDIYTSSTPGSHIILARGSGELERTGIAQGMSGSPVYVDGRLLGALAFAFVDAREPIGGITPAVEMRDQLQPYLERAAAGEDGREDGARMHGARGTLPPGAHGTLPHGAPGTMPPFPEWQRMCATGEWLEYLSAGVRSAPISSSLATPIGLPLVWSGRVPEEDRWREAFASRGLSLLSGGAGSPTRAATPTEAGAGTATGSPESWPRGFAAGDAIGLNLLWGDATAAAIGTVTWTEGNRLYGLGHPFLQTGYLAVPVSRAKIHTVVPTSRVSFKIGTAGPPIGALVADAAPGIVALLDEEAPHLPLELTLRRSGQSGAPERFEFYTAKHHFLTPSLLSMAIGGTLTDREFALGLSTLASRIRIRLPDGRTIEREDLFRTLSPAQTVGAEVLAPVSYLVSNTFEPFAVERVEVELELHDELLALEIEQIRLLEDRVEPGGTLELDVHLRRHLGGHEVRRVAIEVPDGLEGQEIAVMVGSAYAFFEWEREQVPEKYQAQDFEHLLQLIQEFPPNNRLFVRLYGSSRGLVMRGREVPSLPLSKWRALSQSPSAGTLAPLTHRPLAEVVLETEEVILGGVATGAIIDARGPR